jgi:FKBP-type peptidyl-prolyl cis-trans isomerase SlyD
MAELPHLPRRGCDTIRPRQTKSPEAGETVTNDNKPTVVADNVVVTIEYTLLVEGEILDSSEEEGPLEFLQGHSNIIPGLEKELYGMKPGERKQVVVQPDAGYGEFDEEALMDVPRSEFPEEIPLKPGVELEVTDQEGDTQLARIVSVSKSDVKLDFNHPLAGKVLEFDITIKELRQATSEEIDHGHVHAHGHHHDQAEEELDDFEEVDDDFDEEDFAEEDEEDEEDDFDFDDDYDEDEDDDVVYEDLDDFDGDYFDEDDED